MIFIRLEGKIHRSKIFFINFDKILLQGSLFFKEKVLYLEKLRNR
jgi:hypothetical protein